jgi:hypothetical protein
MEYSIEIFLRSMLPISIIICFFLYHLLTKNHELSRIILVYFAVCLIFIHLKWLFAFDLGSYDAALYHSLALRIHDLLEQDFFGNLCSIFQAYSAYTVPLGITYYLFGDIQLLGQIFSAVVGIGVIYNSYHLAEAWFDPKVAKITSLCLAFYPFGWVLAGTLNRDLLIIFFLTFFFGRISDFQKAQGGPVRFGTRVGAVACVAYLTLLRPPLLVLITLSYPVYLLAKSASSGKISGLFKPLRLLGVLAIISTLGLLVFYVGTEFGAKTYILQKATQFMDYEEINKRLANSAEADSAYLTGVRFSSWQDILTALPLTVLYFLFSPLPWQVHTPKHALGLMDSILLIWLVYYFLKGFPSFCQRNRRMALFLLAFLLTGILTSSVIQANVGGAMRHRTMFSFLMLPVAVQGFLNSYRRRRRGNHALPCYPAYGYPAKRGNL